MNMMSMRKIFTVIGFVFILLFFIGRLEADQKEAIKIPLIDTPPQIDGKPDDPVWATAACFQDLITFKPDYGKPASEKTILYLCSDRENFYFAAQCFQQNPSEIKASMTKRDNMFGDDWISICLDTFSDMQSSYAFLINPLGVQGDGMTDNDGNLDESHDLVWFSKGVIDDKGYTVEARIPFKSLRFPVNKEVKMGMWLVRNIVRTSENASFPAMSPNQGATLSQMQPILVSDMKYKRVVELLPALTHSRSNTREEGVWGVEDRQTEISLTGKLGLTPTLVLDAAYNPDFSQVETDAGQVDINLRYALYYQEKRPFFLEGLEEFRFAGNTEDAPLYSIVHTRTIMDPLVGLKLIGKLGRKNSIATILAVDEPLGENGSKADRATFGILRFRHAYKNDSYLGGFYTGRDESEGYNRVAGFDGRWRLSGLALAEFHLLGSMTKRPGEGDTQWGHALGVRYQYGSREFITDLGIQDVSRDFQVDTGFLNRQGLTRLGALALFRFYPKSEFFQRIEPFYWSQHILDKESNLFETLNLFTFRIWMPRSSTFRLDVFLGNEVFAGKRFGRNGIGFQTESQLTKHLYLYLYYRRMGGIYYDPGNPFPGRTDRAFVTLQYQPLEKFAATLELTYSDFFRKSDSHKEYDYTILYSRSTYQVNKYLFFRGIAEYNFYYKKLFLDVLASFTYIPGTVVHIGYGTVLEKNRRDSTLAEYVPADRFRQIHRAFFFKVSYLWRL